MYQISSKKQERFLGDRSRDSDYAQVRALDCEFDADCIRAPVQDDASCIVTTILSVYCWRGLTQSRLDVMPDRGAHESRPVQPRQIDDMINGQIPDNKEGPVCAVEGTVEEKGTETTDGDGEGSYKHIGVLGHWTGRHARPAVAIKARASRSATESKESLMISHIVDLHMFEASSWTIIARKPGSILFRDS